MKQNRRPDSGTRPYLRPLLLAVALVAGRLFLPALAAEIWRPAERPSSMYLRQGAANPGAGEEAWEREMRTLAAETRRSTDGRFRRRHLKGRQEVEAQLSAPPEELLRLLHRLSAVAVLRRFSITPGEKKLYTLYLEAER